MKKLRVKVARKRIPDKLMKVLSPLQRPAQIDRVSPDKAVEAPSKPTQIDEAEVREACRELELRDMEGVKVYFAGKYDPEVLEAFVRYHRIIKLRGGLKTRFHSSDIKKLSEAGLPKEVIAEQLGCSKETVRRALIDEGCMVVRKKPFFPKRSESKLLRLVWSGKTESQAALVAGISDAELVDVMKQVGDRLDLIPVEKFLRSCKFLKSSVRAARRWRCFPSTIVRKLTELDQRPEDLLVDLRDADKIVAERLIEMKVEDGFSAEVIEEIHAQVLIANFASEAALDEHQNTERKRFLAQQRIAKSFYVQRKREGERLSRRRWEIGQELEKETKRIEELRKELEGLEK